MSDQRALNNFVLSDYAIYEPGRSLVTLDERMTAVMQSEPSTFHNIGSANRPPSTAANAKGERLVRIKHREVLLGPFRGQRFEQVV